MGDNIYRHPQRQGSKVWERCIIQHDIYSFRVCLLEVGLRRSFVQNAQDRSPVRPSDYGLHREVATILIIKSRLVSLATKELPMKMGTKCARIVESCLTCLDLGTKILGMSLNFMKMESLSLLDISRRYLHIETESSSTN
jgi:hypothetical protein